MYVENIPTFIGVALWIGAICAVVWAAVGTFIDAYDIDDFFFTLFISIIVSIIATFFFCWGQWANNERADRAESIHSLEKYYPDIEVTSSNGDSIEFIYQDDRCRADIEKVNDQWYLHMRTISCGQEDGIVSREDLRNAIDGASPAKQGDN